MNILITGCAGFIGFHLCNLLLNEKSYKVFGIDNLNDYYDVKLKKDRLKILKKKKNFNLQKLNITNFNKLNALFKKNNFKYVVNLAAQAGVRYSIKNPKNYYENNILGFFNLINLSNEYKIKHFIFASSSSVYGNTDKFPISEKFDITKPLSFYAASKACNEIIAHSYSNIYNLPSTALRFFTAYGPYGRPDMAMYLFADAITKSKKINLFNNGNHYRDFTYVGDLVNVVKKIIRNKPKKLIPFDVFNISGGKSHHIKKILFEIEKNLNKKAKINFMKMQKGDVEKTYSNTKKTNSKFNLNDREKTSIEDGIKIFVDWYREYNS